MTWNLALWLSRSPQIWSVSRCLQTPLKYLLQPARYQLRQQQHVNKAHASQAMLWNNRGFSLAPSGFYACSQIRNKRSECLCLTIAHYILALGGAQIRFYDKSMQKEGKEFQKVCILFFLPLHLDKFSVILCSVQDKPVKERGWCLLIISAALTDVASLWTLKEESTDFFFFFQKKGKNWMIGPITDWIFTPSKNRLKAVNQTD